MAEGSPTVRRRRLGLILREMREHTGMTGDEVGTAMERSASWVSRIEIGKQGMRIRDLRDLLALYEVNDEKLRSDLEELAREGKARGWWNKYGEAVTGPYSAYIGFEAEASELLSYETVVMPGLLQTEDYARALFSNVHPPHSGDQVEQRARIRMARQALLNRVDPVRLWAIMDESVVYRRIGDSQVMHDQLKHLIELAQLPNVTLQIAPFTAGAYPGAVHSFSVLRFPQAADPDLVYIEDWGGGAFAEGDDARRYHDVFNHLRAAALSPIQSVEMIRRELNAAA
ncbi:transcriptional regulator with XRE-family HTH domain [Allocatelliglobosispora scoriae]|uniref:Transcriptional regulator with XRE-family HTH domain n=1 Tax=Allocatelliglobosispora scoriae TaxID=643052 RepID=A0A841BVU1_9ACTN|nr:helix-turn-helix transcriptional regulator [Allocatelliglobosispora scoriae]MBB5871795.1 transcriptional regulator with XRE-family HTH domain [Allocatelliglobosispora scoriae]